MTVSPRVVASVRRTFSSVRSSPNFRRYLIGLTISAIGTWMGFTASSWLVLQLTGSGTLLGVNAALMFGPVLLLGAWGGVLADRFDKRKIILWAQVVYALVAITMGLLILFDLIQLWMVFALSVAAGIVIAIENPTRQSFYVEMVGEEELTNAVSLHSAAFTGARVMGPAVAGILIANVGLAACYLLDGLSFFALVFALWRMNVSELHPQARAAREKGQLVAGLRYVWETPQLRRPLLMMVVVFTLSFQWQVLVPLLAERTLGSDARGFGFLSAASGVGSFIGAIVMANRNARPTLQRLAVFGVAAGLSLAVTAAVPTLLVAAIVMVPVGFTAMTFMITGNTSLQLHAKPEMRGRVMALYGIVFLGSTTIGSPVVGWFADHIGVRPGFLASGLIAMTVGAGALLARRRIIARRGAETTAAAS